jgi:two-component system capsular synthesis sensor histidine kinase RcsC
LKGSQHKLIYSLDQTARLHSQLLDKQHRPGVCDTDIVFPGELGARRQSNAEKHDPGPFIVSTLEDTGCNSRLNLLRKLSSSLASSIHNLWDYPEVTSYTFDPQGRFLARGGGGGGGGAGPVALTAGADIGEEIAAATAHFQPGIRHLREAAPTPVLPLLVGVHRSANAEDKVLSIGVPIYKHKDRLFAITAIDIERHAFDKVFMPAGRLPGFFVFDASRSPPVLLNDIRANEHASVQSILKKWPAINTAAHDLSVVEIGRRFYFSEAVPGTPWVAVYSFDFGDILMVSESLWMWISFSMFGSLLLLWGGIYLVNRYVLVPLSLASQRIVASEELNRTIIATAPVGLCMLDLQSMQPLLANDLARAYAQRWGQCPDLARSILQAYRAIAGPGGDVRRSEAVLYTELPAPQKIDAPPLLAAFSHVRYQERDVLLCGLSDITMHKEAEAMLQQARQSADQANEAKSMFLATISHEIRTPLHGAMGNLELLENTPLSPSQRSTLGIINRAFFSLLQIINNVLDLSKAGAGQLNLSADSFDLIDLLEDVARTFAPLIAKKNVQFLCLLDSRLPNRMQGDEARLRQIFNNLLSNAVKFTDSGKIVMRADLSARQNGDCAFTVQIIDSGIGISAYDQDKLFMPFQQANSTIAGTFGGTGLGLSLVKSLCEAMGGSIKINSRESQGACFTVALKLPVASDAAHNSAAVQPQPLDGVSIALHCDDPLWRRHLRTQLEAKGAAVSDAETQAIGTQAVDTRRPCDTLLIACQDGQEDIYRPLLAHYPHARHVLLTPLGPLPPERQAGCVRVSALSQRSLAPAVDPASDAALVPAAHTEHRVDEIERTDAGRDRYAADDAAAEASERIAAAPDASTLRILLVEDDLVNVALAQQQLAMLGHTGIDLARNGREALEKCRRHAYQLILTDQFMPEMNGNHLAATLRQQAYPAVIIMVTASRPSAADRKNLDAVLLKPVSLEQLRTVLSCHRPPLPQAAQPCGRKILWDAFFQDYAGTMDTLEAALAANDKTACLQQLHKLKGALEILQQPLAKQVATLERRSKTTPLAELAHAYRTLRQSLDRLVRSARIS